MISFVSRGKVRKKVLDNLVEPHTPTELSQIINTHRSTTSRAILALERKELVECITPNEKMGRYYQNSQKGNEILKMIKRREKWD